jgi:hypothetical protein
MDRRPIQLAVVFGATTGLYAVSLGTVTMLQADHDLAVAALRAPVSAGVGALGDANDRLAAELDQAVAMYDTAADAYSAAAASIVGHEERLAQYGAVVTEVTGSAAALPRGVPMPKATRAVGRTTTIVHATTGSSGAP